MTTNNSLSTIPSVKSKQSGTRSRLKSRQLVTLVLGFSILLISTVFHNQVWAGSLFIALIATSFDRQLNQLVKKLNSFIKLWQVEVAIAVTAVFVSLGMSPVNAQAVPGGGLFNPLQQQTNSVLTAAGAGEAGNSILGIFSLMNIIVTIAGVGAVVYGAYQQSQGHTLRESFTPLALVLVVYLGCSFVMRMFLGTTA